LLSHSQGINATRLLLGRLRDDIHHLAPTKLARIAAAAAPYAWTHITVYLDIIAQVNTNRSKAHRARHGSHALDRLLDPLHLPYELSLPMPDTDQARGWDDWRIVADMVVNVPMRELVTVLDPHNIRPDERDLDRLFELLGVSTAYDVIVLISLRDLLDLSDVRVLRKLYDIPARFVESGHPQGPEWPGWSNSPILRLALWAAMRRRGLPELESPARLVRSEVERLEAVVPNFVTQIRQLAAESGVADPLVPVPASRIIHARARRMRPPPVGRDE
jgi:hypothetical protein